MLISSVHLRYLEKALITCDGMDLTAKTTHSSPFDTSYATELSVIRNTSSNRYQTILKNTNSAQRDLFHNLAKIITKKKAEKEKEEDKHTLTNTKEENYDICDNFTQRYMLHVYGDCLCTIALAKTNISTIPIDQASSHASLINPQQT